MASTSITGHAINVANFKTLITNVKGFGPAYNPVLFEIQLPQLEEKYNTSKAKLDKADTQKKALNTAINDRKKIFIDLEQLCTQVVNAFEAIGASPEDIKELRAINKKIQGPSSKKKTEENTETADNKETQETDIENQSPKQISTSQQSFKNKINFFHSLIDFLENRPIYNPNEDELKLVNLKKKHDMMQERNDIFDKQFFIFNNALIDRNKELYNNETGMIETAKKVKKYIRSIFKSNSPEFKLVNSIEFRNYK